MKIIRIFREMSHNKRIGIVERTIPPCPIVYDRNNVTAQEFKEYVHYLAKNKINHTFIEPDRFITEAERQERNEFRKHLKYLSDNKINKMFYC